MNGCSVEGKFRSRIRTHLRVEMQVKSISLFFFSLCFQS